jgi:hypothetical protein
MSIVIAVLAVAAIRSALGARLASSNPEIALQIDDGRATALLRQGRALLEGTRATPMSAPPERWRWRSTRRRVRRHRPIPSTWPRWRWTKPATARARWN